jgi:hypothetical protein
MQVADLHGVSRKSKAKPCSTTEPLPFGSERGGAYVVGRSPISISKTAGFEIEIGRRPPLDERPEKSGQ